jgi:hypothetical protein
MELIQKNIDSRGLIKSILSKTVDKSSKRLAQIRELVRRKYLSSMIKKKYRMETQKSLDDQHYGGNCGKYGFVEIDKDGNKQYRPIFCNLFHMCFECFNRYKRHVFYQNMDRISAVAAANDVSTIVTPVYTLHPEIRHYLTTCDELEKAGSLNEITNLAVESFKRAIGLGGNRGRDVTGIISVMHPFGSRNPFQPFLHFHLIWIPLKITKDGKLEKMVFWIDHKKAKEIWQKAQEGFAERRGFKLASKKTNINFSYIYPSNERQFRHKMRYIFRSLIDDIFKSVSYFTDDLEEFAWLEDLDADWGLHIDKWDVFERALENYMSFPVKMIRSYGFLRNLKKHSNVLGIMQVMEVNTLEPVTTVPAKFKRTYRRRYIEGLKKWVFELNIQVKYNGLPWHSVPVESVVGEFCSGKVRNRWVRAP